MSTKSPKDVIAVADADVKIGTDAPPMAQVPTTLGAETAAPTNKVIQGDSKDPARAALPIEESNNNATMISGDTHASLKEATSQAQQSDGDTHGRGLHASNTVP